MKRNRQEDWVLVWHELRATEGGRGSNLTDVLKSEGIPARTCHSCYVGHIGIEVPESKQKKALKFCTM